MTALQIIPQLEPDVEAIYTEAFPPNQREPFDHILDDVAAGRRHGWVARVGEQVLGMAVVRPLKTDRVAVLEYLAVDRCQRGRSIGSALLTAVVAALRHDLTTDALLLEVEPVDGQCATPSQYEIRQRRAAFYQRHGAHRISAITVYRMPDLTGNPAGVPMDLWWLPVSGTPQMPDIAQLQRILVALHLGYGLPADHPWLAAVLAQVQHGNDPADYA